MTQNTDAVCQRSHSAAIRIDARPFPQSRCCLKRVGCTRTSRCLLFGQYSDSSRRVTRWEITTCTSKHNIFVVLLPCLWTLLTNVISSNVKAEVGGGIMTSGLFFHGTNRACTLGDKRTKDALCSKKECSLCAIIRDSYDIDKTGMRSRCWFTS